MAEWIQEPNGVKLSEKGWTSSCDEKGKITLTKNIIGDYDTVRTQYTAHVNAEGGVAQLSGGEFEPPLSGRFIILGATFAHKSPGMAEASLSYGTLDGGQVITSEGQLSSDNKHFETADFQNITQPIACAKFWLDGFGISEAAVTPTTLRDAWKATQVFIDASGSYEDVKKAYEDFIADAQLVQWKGTIDKMVAKRLAGIEEFYTPAPTISYTDVITSFPNNYGDSVAKVYTSPSGFENITPPSGFTWLGMSDTIEFDGVTFKRTVSYVGARYWDTDLYGAAI